MSATSVLNLNNKRVRQSHSTTLTTAGTTTISQEEEEEEEELEKSSTNRNKPKSATTTTRKKRAGNNNESVHEATGTATAIQNDGNSSPSLSKRTRIARGSTNVVQETNNIDHDKETINVSKTSTALTIQEKRKSAAKSTTTTATTTKSSSSPPPPKKDNNDTKKLTKKEQLELDKERLSDGLPRCSWANNPLWPAMQAYHDQEWSIKGGFNRSNQYLFEMLILESAQAGLSWSTILNKREAYRSAYDQFDYHVIASTFISPEANHRLLQTDIVKNKLKVEASIANAKAFVALLNAEYPTQTGLRDTEGFWNYLLTFKRPKDQHQSPPSTSSTGPIEKTVMSSMQVLTPSPGKSGSVSSRTVIPQKQQQQQQQYVTRSHESDRLSADLKMRGFKFVGTTIMYAFLQAVGIVEEDHAENCFRHVRFSQGEE